MDDTYAHFLIAVQQLCLQAELGGLRVEVGDRAGECRTGVPLSLGPPEPGWPGDATSAIIEVDETPIRLEHVVMCAILAPTS